MENILDSKQTITNEINTIFTEYQKRIEENASKEKEWMKEKELIHQANNRLIQEVAEKDKLLFHNEKKFLDYEIMINKIQDEALKEHDTKTKHDMLRAQDKEIFNRDEEIKRLNKRIQCLEEEKKLVVSTVEEVIQDVEEFKEDINSDKTVSNVVVIDKTPMVDRSGKSGIKLVEKIMDVMDTIKKEGEDEEKEEEKEEKEEEKEEKDEDMTDEEDITVSTITHYKKEYYIIDGEEPIQYIYAIEDGDLGEVKGEMRDGKKHMYKNKK